MQSRGGWGGGGVDWLLAAVARITPHCADCAGDSEVVLGSTDGQALDSVVLLPCQLAETFA